MSTPGILWGSMGLDTHAVDTALEQAVGKRQSLSHMAQSWAYGRKADSTPNYAPFPADMLSKAQARGTLVLLDWVSWDLQNQADLAFNLPAIIRGDHDAYLHQWAQAAAAWKHPLILLFDVEANGDWLAGGVYQEQRAGTGNSPGDFVRMWRHVHDIFQAEGATNIAWCWCMNIMAASGSVTATPIDRFYPGDEYVDWTGLDGFDYGLSKGGRSHQTFEQVFRGVTAGSPWLKDSYAELLRVAPSKPICIASFGSTAETLTAPDGDGPGKAKVIASIFDGLGRMPAVRALTYFNWTPERRWPLNLPASGEAMAVFQAGIQSPTFIAAGAWVPADMRPPGPPIMIDAAVSALQAQVIDLRAALADVKTQLGTAQLNLDAARAQAVALNDTLVGTETLLYQSEARCQAQAEQISDLTARLDDSEAMRSMATQDAAAGRQRVADLLAWAK